MKVSAAIITFNEAENIRSACDSLAWADEIVVVDSRSTDHTREIASQCGARGWSQLAGFAEQKQFATEEASMTHDSPPTTAGSSLITYHLSLITDTMPVE